MAKLNAVVTGTNVVVDGVTYRKVTRRAAAGDIVMALETSVDIERGAFYKVTSAGSGSVCFPDDVGFPRTRSAETYEVYEPVTVADELTLRYDRVGEPGAGNGVDIRVGDVIVYEEGPCSYVEADKPYVVTEVDEYGDAQIIDEDGDEYDTSDDAFTTYRLKPEQPKQILPVPEVAEFVVGDTVKLTIAPGALPKYGWGWAKSGDVGTVRTVGTSDIYVDFPKQSGWHGLKSEFVKVPEQPAQPEATTDPRSAFAVGDKVRLQSGGDTYPLNGFSDNSVYKVTTPLYSGHGNRRVEIKNDKSVTGYALPEQLEKVTEQQPEIIDTYRLEPRKAGRGDKIAIVANTNRHSYETSDVVEVTGRYSLGEGRTGVETSRLTGKVRDTDYLVLVPDAGGNVVIHNGKAYRKEARRAEVGEKVLVVESFCYGEKGDIATVTESPAISGDVRTDKHELMNDNRYVVLVPVTKTDKPEAARPTVGDYVKLVDTSGMIGDKYLGQIAEIIEDDGSIVPYWLRFLSDDVTKVAKECRVKLATPEEAAEAKRQAELTKRIPVGTYVKTLRQGGRYIGCTEFPIGTIGKVTKDDKDPKRPYKVEALGDCFWYDADDLEVMAEAEAVETQKWATIGRKPNEYKRGDIVRIVRDQCGDPVGTVTVVEEVSETGRGHRVKATGRTRTSTWAADSNAIELVTPVEQRFDVPAAS